MAQKSKGTARAVVMGKMKVKAKIVAKTKAKATPVMAVASVKEPVKGPNKQIAMAKEALKATIPAAKSGKVVKPGKPEKPGKAEKPGRARKISMQASADEASSALAQKWMSLFKKSEQIEAKPYNMKAVFEEKTAIVHKVLGWGYILANRNDRLEVLFKDGIKHLISNYKP